MPAASAPVTTPRRAGVDDSDSDTEVLYSDDEDEVIDLTLDDDGDDGRRSAVAAAIVLIRLASTNGMGANGMGANAQHLEEINNKYVFQV